MWILNWLPDWVFHLILVAGVLAIIVGWVLKAIPVVKQNALPIQVFGILLTILGVWYEGGIAKDAEYKEKIAELKSKIADSEVQSAKTNTKIVTKLVTKTQVIKEKGDTVTQYIEKEVAVADAECKVPQAAIKAHDASALGKPIDEVVLTSNSTVSAAEHDKLATTKAKKSWRDYLPK